MSVIGNPLLLSPEGYQIERSVRLRSSASAYFNRTPASAGNRKTWTWSGWVKRGALSSQQWLFSCKNSTLTDGITFEAANTLALTINSATGGQRISSAVFRDTSAWYHIVVVYDSSNATAEDRIRLYINGQRLTSWSSTTAVPVNTDSATNTVNEHDIGKRAASSSHFDGYLTEVNFIDGQALTPSSFGETDAVTGVWKPKKYAGTYGTNGFYLNFSDPSSTTTIGYDYSGNGNNWTSNNISVTAGVTYDSMIDVPTPYADGGNGRGNYATLNPLSIYVVTPTDGNLAFSGTSAGGIGSMGVSSGKYYWESVYTAIGSGDGVIVGVRSAESVATGAAENVGYYGGGTANGKKIIDGGTGTSYGSTWTTGDVIGVALDIDGGSITFYKNNVSQGAISYTFTGKSWVSFNWRTGAAGTNTGTINFGQRPFAYTPPTGFKALNTQNLPEPTIVDGGEYFNPVLYTGTGSSQDVTGVGFQPDLVWIKQRSSATSNGLYDSIRGAGKVLYSNVTNAEEDKTAVHMNAFNADGFTVLTDSLTNASGGSYVAWNWKANGAGVSNTAGSITSTVSAGVTQGFSVVTYTGTGANATVGHGLGVAPKMVVIKSRSQSANWTVYHSSVGNTGALFLNLTNATDTGSAYWNNTSPTSSVFTINLGSASNTSGQTYVAYCFAEVPGFSKFGSYTGNGSSTDGPFVFCGFRPAFVMIKRTDGSASWSIRDSGRNPSNVASLELRPDSSVAEYTDAGGGVDLVSNGFKLRSTTGGNNVSGGTFIYMAFAENPFKNALAR